MRRTVLLLAGLLGCASPPSRDAGFDAAPPLADAEPIADGAVALDDATAGEVDAGVECAENPIPLLTINFGDTDRYFIAAEIDRRPVAFQLDTGSNISFVFTGTSAPAFTPDFGRITVGCEIMTVAGRGLAKPDQRVGNDLEVIGLIGMDFLLARPTLLEIAALRITRHRDRPEQLIARSRLEIAFDVVQSLALVPLELDGQAVRLMFDTGGGHTLWVGQNGRPGDREEQVQDAQGTIFPIYVGTATLTFPGGPPRVIPVARAPAFPYFEETVRALGGNLHGLLGVTAFPGERLLFLGAERRLLLIPP